MGYHTDFDGGFELDRPLTPEVKAFLVAFNQTRRMKRDAEKTAKRSDPVREAVGLPVGKQGEFFVGEDGMMGQGHGEDITDYNSPPDTQPGLWCQWCPNDDGTAIIWDGGEKFYHYVEWLRYIIKNFFRPWGYYLSGEVEWTGEDPGDMGRIVVESNNIRIYRGSVVYTEE